MRRRRAALLIFFALSGCTRPAHTPERPVLLLLTSLPLVVGDRFALDAVGSPALDRLDRSFRVRAIGVADRSSLGAYRLLLMAHPRAQPADALIDLDSWVRRGGLVILLADPKLDWPSSRPLGDRLRPPPSFADSGLLAHWGLTLEPSVAPGPANRTLAGGFVVTSSPGRLVRIGSSDCAIANDGFVSRCRIGRGEVMVIADADFLNVSGRHANPAGTVAGASQANLDALVTAIETLVRGRPATFGRSAESRFPTGLSTVPRNRTRQELEV